MQDRHRVDKAQRRRQDPISCQLCRLKKLKCNRQQPCSNCLARGATCEAAHVSVIDWDRRESVSIDKNAAVLARLQKLEEAVFGKSESTPSSIKQTPDPENPTPVSRFVDASGEEAEAAYSELEVVGTRDESLLSGLSEGIVFRIGHIQETVLMRSVFPEHSVASHSDWDPAKTIWMPPKEDAKSLFEYYAANAECFYRVILVSSVRDLLERVYGKLLQRQPVESSHASLLLSIFASSASDWPSPVGEDDLFQDQRDTAKATIFWSKAALDVLEHSRRTGRGSLDDIQASIILLFLIYKNEGFSIRCRYLLSTAITIGRDLSLHKLDIPCRRGQTGDAHSDSAAELEIKRRVWWHLASTDWLTGIGGPQEGTYLVQPKQMCVKMPRNINEEDLYQQEEGFQRPLSEPTSMSYSICRIRLAEICRTIIDALPPHSSGPENRNYEDIISLDGKIETFLQELPIFFRFDEDSSRKSQDVFRQFPQIIMQRYIININTHFPRCKLNQPFLIRGSLEPRFSYSRDHCLRSARIVIEINKKLAREIIPFIPDHGRLCGFIHQVFVATIILVMDLCFNRIPGQEDALRAEVTDACKMLEDAKQRSPIAGKFLESLMDILRKYKIRLLPPERIRAIHERIPAAIAESKDIIMATSEGATTAADAARAHDVEMPTNQQYPAGLQETESDFEEIWQSYMDYGPNFDMPDWDHLFSDLDSNIP